MPDSVKIGASKLNIYPRDDLLMDSVQDSPNAHVKQYLEYYCEPKYFPKFAVLLKGEWGIGKTWFVDQYRKELEAKGRKVLYVSLYGLSSFSEIEFEFFRQLQPFLASKGMEVVGKLLKGMLRTSLKIDLDGDGKDNASIISQLPDIDVSKYLSNVNESILIFDDLERCQIPLISVLGYINSFVEHQNLKVIIVANEDEVKKLLPDDRYAETTEKIIGQILEIKSEFNAALKSFIAELNDTEVRLFLSLNCQEICQIYAQGGYENLRVLRRIIQDFARIYQKLPDRACKKTELLQDVLKLLAVLSIEINCDSISPAEINNMKEGLKFTQHRAGYQILDSGVPEIQEKLVKYNLDFEFFPTLEWWKLFFNEGFIDLEKLESSLAISQYFKDENTPDWIKLWRFTDLQDDEFVALLDKIRIDFQNLKILDVGEIIHIVGIWLYLSKIDLYGMNKEEILLFAKECITRLRKENKLEAFPLDLPVSQMLSSGEAGKYFLSVKGLEDGLYEFIDFLDEERKSVAFEDVLPNEAGKLLMKMTTNPPDFYHALHEDSPNSKTSSNLVFHKVPILSHIPSDDFVKSLLSMNSFHQQATFWAITRRYKHISNSHNAILLDELDWLKSVRNLILTEVSTRSGKLSAYRLKTLLEADLNKDAITDIIQRLEDVKASQSSVPEPNHDNN
jgi:KAP family P-loop domain